MSKFAVTLSVATMLAVALVAPTRAQQPPAPAMPGHDMPQHGHQMMDHGRPAAAIEDKRQTITLTAAERDFVLMEMRAFLDNVQGIVASIADDKPKDAAKFARGSGMGATHGMPPGMMMKMPPEFRMIGMDTHKRFDTFAMEADSIGDAKQLLTQLAGILANCTGCHAAYRLTVTP